MCTGERTPMVAGSARTPKSVGFAVRMHTELAPWWLVPSLLRALTPLPLPPAARFCSWGGRGRAGLVGACLLAHLYGLPAEEALERVQRSFDTRKDGERGRLQLGWVRGRPAGPGGSDTCWWGWSAGSVLIMQPTPSWLCLLSCRRSPVAGDGRAARICAHFHPAALLELSAAAAPASALQPAQVPIEISLPTRPRSI